MTTRTSVGSPKLRHSNNADGSRYKTYIMVCDTSHESRRSNTHDRNTLPVITANIFSSSAAWVPCGHHEHPIPSGAPATQWTLPASRRHAIPVGSTAETNSKNIASRLVSLIPAWLRNYANVPSAINRPSAMMPIRLAIRSATSNIWVAMITCASRFSCATKTSFTTRADSVSCPVNISSKKPALYYAPTQRPTRLLDALAWKNPVSVHAHWSQGATYRSVRELGGRGRQFPESSDGFKILKRREFFINHRLRIDSK